jgi:hypothetical protein
VGTLDDRAGYPVAIQGEVARGMDLDVDFEVGVVLARGTGKQHRSPALEDPDADESLALLVQFER